jgi:uncharacterized phage protein (TIGR01671 family)
MNRELKFRIWDKQNKNWLKNSSSLHCYSNWAICPFTGNLVDYVGDYGCDSFTSSPAVDYYFEGAEIIKEPRYVIQQYTGLKDKNGKEIYEGDIVRAQHEILNFRHKENKKIKFEYGVIHWCESYWAIGEYKLFVMNDKNLKVIGNIFDNPELIKKP